MRENFRVRCDGITTLPSGIAISGLDMYVHDVAVGGEAHYPDKALWHDNTEAVSHHYGDQVAEVFLQLKYYCILKMSRVDDCSSCDK